MSNDNGLTRETVQHIAGLSRITLTDAETDTLTDQLSHILDAIQKVSEVAGDDIAATSHPVPLTNVTRTDEVRDVLTQEQALQNAPAQAEGMFQVTAILGEEQ